MSVTVTIPEDAIPGVVGYISEGLREEYALVVEGDGTVSGGLSPVEWAVLPFLVPHFEEDDRQLVLELLAKVNASDPGCKRHRGDPHHLCPECWKAETP